MSAKNKKLRVETKLPAEFFPSDLTVAQLREALKQRGIDHKPLKLKQELVEKLQQALAAEKAAAREQRIQALSAGNSSASSSASSSSASSSSASASPENRRVTSLFRISADCLVTVTQCLEFGEIAAFAGTCSRLNALASLKLQGQPSLALARRKFFGGRFAKPGAKALQRLLERLSSVETIEFGSPVVRGMDWHEIDMLLKTCRGSLRSFNLTKDYPRMPFQSLQLVLSAPRLRSLAFTCDAVALAATVKHPPSPLNALESLSFFVESSDSKAGMDAKLQLLSLAPNLTSLTSDFFGPAVARIYPKLQHVTFVEFSRDQRFDFAHVQPLTNLQTLTVAQATFTPLQQDVLLPTLSALSISLSDSLPAPFFTRLKLPRLKALEVLADELPSDAVAAAVCDLLPNTPKLRMGIFPQAYPRPILELLESRAIQWPTLRLSTANARLEDDAIERVQWLLPKLEIDIGQQKFPPLRQLSVGEWMQAIRSQDQLLFCCSSSGGRGLEFVTSLWEADNARLKAEHARLLAILNG